MHGSHSLLKNYVRLSPNHPLSVKHNSSSSSSSSVITPAAMTWKKEHSLNGIVGFRCIHCQIIFDRYRREEDKANGPNCYTLGSLDMIYKRKQFYHVPWDYYIFPTASSKASVGNSILMFALQHFPLCKHMPQPLKIERTALTKGKSHEKSLLRGDDMSYALMVALGVHLPTTTTAGISEPLPHPLSDSVKNCRNQGPRKENKKAAKKKNKEADDTKKKTSHQHTDYNSDSSGYYSLRDDTEDEDEENEEDEEDDSDDGDYEMEDESDDDVDVNKTGNSDWETIFASDFENANGHGVNDRNGINNENNDEEEEDLSFIDELGLETAVSRAFQQYRNNKALETDSSNVLEDAKKEWAAAATSTASSTTGSCELKGLVAKKLTPGSAVIDLTSDTDLHQPSKGR
mmetsp:Transcript_15550/g.22318  ORF Transcript_15550/g.22318 Transcript_15550/m.22318 type:complete len:402 (+) Transcript_15550:38-1243(+)